MYKEFGNPKFLNSFDSVNTDTFTKGMEMSVKKVVRVIKKGEKTQDQKTVSRKNSARDTARDMVQTVTNWVTEFQQKRRTETATALKLLSETPPPSRA
jgi:hypothetical protein